MLGANEREGCPQSLEPVEKAATGKMAGRQSRDCYGTHGYVVGPVQRSAERRVDTKDMENLLNAKRGNPASILKLRQCRKAANGARTEVIVVIVRNDNSIDGRQILECKRRGKETLGASPLRWRRALLPNGIDEQTHSVDFNQGGGVPHPGNSQAGQRAGGKGSRVSMEGTELMFW